MTPRAVLGASLALLGTFLVMPAAGNVAPTGEPAIRHAHSSSLYDGPKSELRAQMKRLVRASDPSANLATLTEVGSKTRTKILKDAAPKEWGAYVSGKSDVGFMWRKSDWEVRWHRAHKLTNRVWTDGKGRRHTTYAVSAKLVHRSGRVLFLSVCHLPSHVEYGNRFRDNAQARAWKDAVRGWHRYWQDFRKEHRPDLAMLAADWNIDVKRKAWRQRLADVFPSMVLNWVGHMPSKGSHGNRLIDATLATKTAARSRLLPDDDSSDHRPYGDAYRWK